MSSDLRLNILKIKKLPKETKTPKSLKMRSDTDINIKLSQETFNNIKNLNSLTNLIAQKPKPKSIDISKQFPFIKNNFKITKKIDLYPDQNRNFKDKMVKKFHNFNFLNKYDDEYLRKIFQLMKRKDKNYFKMRDHVDKTELALDSNNNLILTLNNNIPLDDNKKKAKQRKLTILSEKEILENELIYKYRNINYQDPPQTEVHFLSEFEKNIPEFMDKSIESFKDEDELYSHRNKNVLDETDSSLFENSIRKDLYNKISKNNKSYKVLSLSKARFDNGKRIVNNTNDGNTFTNNSNSPHIPRIARKTSPNTFSISSNITGIINIKKDGHNKFLDKTDTYRDFVEKMRHLTYNYHHIRKDDEKKSSNAKDLKNKDLNKCLKESDNMINRIIKLDGNRVDKLLKLKLKIEEDKNKTKLKMV